MKFRKIILTAIAVAGYLTPALSQEHSGQWPQFRGPEGRGILDSANVPVAFDPATGQNLMWKIRIPGLAHSCPVVWDDRVYLTTAVGQTDKDDLKIGLYGDIDMAQDTSLHEFRVYCLDRSTGRIIWERLADKGYPKERRHTKSTYANPTPATDGSRLVVSFGSHGLYCYDLSGSLIWKKDLGNLATGPFNEDGVEWGYSSSPVIHDGKVIVQCDLLKDSFLAVLDLRNGNEIWRVGRDAISSWASPAVSTLGDRKQIILNAYPFVSARDFQTGAEIWKIGNVGDAPAPTPVVANGLIFVNSAHGKFSPILAIRPEAAGDITLPADSTSSRHVAWSYKRGGAYMASPMVYGNYLYNMQISGLLTVIDIRTGGVVYKKETGKAFSASAVASDNHLYFPAETGEVLVVEAGPEFRLIAENKLEDPVMATPALADGMILIRTQHFLMAFGEKK